eukprot:6124855-Ditylum_brightwellii.AAC.1
MVLFLAPPLVGQDLKEIKLKHGRSLYKWASTLQFVTQKMILDIGYSVMRISGFMSSPNKLIFDVHHLTVHYLYHPPHKPITYPRKPVNEPKLASHFKTEKAEYSKLYKSIITSSPNADLACDLRYRRYTTSNIITVNRVAIHWYNGKQTKPNNATSNAELMSLHKM